MADVELEEIVTVLVVANVVGGVEVDKVVLGAVVVVLIVAVVVVVVVVVVLVVGGYWQLAVDTNKPVLQFAFSQQSCELKVTELDLPHIEQSAAQPYIM